MQSMIRRLQEGRTVADICGLHGGSRALFLAEACATLERTILAIVATDDLLEPLAQDIGLFARSPVLIYPSFEIPPYTPLSPDPATVATRLSTLHRLQENDRAAIVLTSAEAILRRILPRKALNDRSELLIRGEEVERDRLIDSLTMAGYQVCDLVRQEGDLAVRGGIVDVFAPATENGQPDPLRLDFFGDTLESLRYFDPLTQRSIREVEEAVLLPPSDILFPARRDQERWRRSLAATLADFDLPREQVSRLMERLGQQVRFPGIEFFLPLLYGGTGSLQTLFDYLPADAILVLNDPDLVGQQVDLVQERIRANFREAREDDHPALPPDALFLDREELDQRFSTFTTARLCTLPDPDRNGEPVTIRTGDHSLLRQEIELERKKRGLLAPLADRIIRWRQRGETSILACRSGRQAAHLQEMLAGYRIRCCRLEPPLDLAALPNAAQVGLVEHPLSGGFDLPESRLHLLSATELFGEKRLIVGRAEKKGAPQGEPVRIEELSPDDVVVHRDHGLGIFRGLVNMEFAGQRGDFMEIEYRSGDRLYVPVDRLHWVSRYQGLDDQQPRLDRLGSSRWQATKKKVTDEVWKVARELLEIYASREIRKGHRFSPPGQLYHALEESFPHNETSGQARAIADVLDDLTSDRPMDRLICGDVGYGKTEVAVRAAAKVIEDGFQVAVLVPTTVLAEQHAATFSERFAGLPVRVACLNRFRTPAEQRQISSELAAGTLDLVVGTHRLLSGDIHYNRLGLLIVDEEHRFGVTHKEKIKKMRATVDVLTLTATPIPRTLQMSLLGIRDLSVISTPPRRRRAVKTFLARTDRLVIREAVTRELARGGQLFFVHNRVRTIHRVAETIEEQVPQARIGVAHGQMSGRQLEEIMVRFIRHEIDVLVCTTIIESGLDIANANTIIINRADHLGLADIYQLRGRVGRSSRQSYAYLLVPSLEELTRDAKKRLRALMDCSELGGGFKLAMNDLQIRGGGNLLGVSQSGHIAAVGYDLYLELVQSTVAELKRRAAMGGENGEPEIDPEIKLRVSGFLPDDYIEDPSQRYHMYRRISAAGGGDREVLAELRDELEDRYGRLPDEAGILLQIIGLKQRLRSLGIRKLEQGPDSLVFTFIDRTPIDPQAIIGLIDRAGRGQSPRMTPDQRLIVPLADGAELFAAIDRILASLAGEGS
ncbi:transcription-repair coupling factor [Thermodesulfobacteriota bacterium B35]